MSHFDPCWRDFRFFLDGKWRIARGESLMAKWSLRKWLSGTEKKSKKMSGRSLSRGKSTEFFFGGKKRFHVHFCVNNLGPSGPTYFKRILETSFQFTFQGRAIRFICFDSHSEYTCSNHEYRSMSIVNTSLNFVLRIKIGHIFVDRRMKLNSFLSIRLSKIRFSTCRLFFQHSCNSNPQRLTRWDHSEECADLIREKRSWRICKFNDSMTPFHRLNMHRVFTFRWYVAVLESFSVYS